MTGLERKFKATLRDLPMPRSVALARSVVRAQLNGQGIDLEENMQPLVERLVGKSAEGQLRDDAMLALGVAVGQLYHPDVFADGGAQ